MPPAFSASRAGVTPEASGHGSSGTFGKKMRRSSFIFLIGLFVLFCGLPIWNKMMTMIITAERDHTMKMFEDAQSLAYAVLEADSDRESKALASIYPRDLGITSGGAYLAYLEQQGVISFIPKTSRSIRISNVSRSDSADTIFLTSIGTMRDIHTMIHNIGGYPNYKKGYISVRKNGTGQFYASTVPLESTGQEPPNEPHFLKAEE